MQRVTLDEARERLGDLIDSAVKEDEVVIARDGRPVAKIVPVGQARARPRFGSAKGLIEMSEDFDAPLDDSAEYTKSGCSSTPTASCGSRWAARSLAPKRGP